MERQRGIRGLAVLAIATICFAGGAAGASADQSDNDANEASVAAGTLDDGHDLLPLARISIDEAAAAAQSAARGRVGEIDLEYVEDTLAFNVDIGAHDVKLDAATGAVLAVDADD